jgi:hypothetical protein
MLIDVGRRKLAEAAPLLLPCGESLAGLQQGRAAAWQPALSLTAASCM